MLKQAMPAATEQNTLEMQLRQVRDAVRSKIKRMGGMQDGLLKDTETALERDFTDMRSVMRELEILAEDQEEEEDEDTLHRLQQYQQQYQDLQTAYSNAKLANKTDPHEANRQMLLAGADPTKRQRELQTEAEMVGAAQSTTGSLQRSRQVLVEQIDSTQTILASMDASHEQLQKVTTEYQGQSDVYGSSKRLLRTLKRHSSWDKLVLYGGAAMFLLVCLYVVQKRSLYFVPTFVKSGLGKIVPTWSRSSSQEADQLIRPIKGRGDDPGTDGFRQKPSPETLRNTNQADALLQRHASPSHAAPSKLRHAAPAQATGPPDKGSQSVVQTDSPPQAQAQIPPAIDSPQHAAQDKPTADGQPSKAGMDRQQPGVSVTQKQMQDSGYGAAFAQIMEGIPDHIKNHPSTQTAEPEPALESGAPQPEPGLAVSDAASSSEVGAAVAAAMHKVTEQQQHQAVGLDAGQAYPEHVAQVSSGDQALPHHSAMLRNHSASQGQSSGEGSDNGKSASDQHLQGAMPDNIASGDDTIELQDSITHAVEKILNNTANSSDPALLGEHGQGQEPQTVHPERAGDRQDLADQTGERAESDAALPLQSAADSLGSVSQSAPGQSVPQEATARSQADAPGHFGAAGGPSIVTQQQMDESGHADAFAEIMESIPDHIKNAASSQSQHQEPAKSEVRDSVHCPDNGLRSATDAAEEMDYEEYLEP